MRRAIFALSLLFIATAAVAEEPADVLRMFHEALAAKQPDQARAQLGTTFFMADEKSAGGNNRMGAHLYLTGERLNQWPRNYLTQVGPYKNEFRVLNVNSRFDAAVVITSDTGSNKFRSWKDEEVAWLLGREGGSWKIVGMIIRDIQLPRD